MKSNKFLTSLLVSTLALSSGLVMTSQVQAQYDDEVEEQAPEELTTVFRCVREGGSFATIAQRGDRTTSPIFQWRTAEFGPQYTPQQRCQLVSDRLTRAVSENAGRLSNLFLTTGTVNRLPVVCYLNSGASTCNSRNLLFTLDSRNARNPNAVLDSLVNFGVSGTGAPIQSLRASGSSNRPRRVNLEALVESAFPEGDSDNQQPVPRPNPGTRPGTNPNTRPGRNNGI